MIFADISRPTGTLFGLALHFTVISLVTLHAHKTVLSCCFYKLCVRVLCGEGEIIIFIILFNNNIIICNFISIILNKYKY